MIILKHLNNNLAKKKKLDFIKRPLTTVDVAIFTVINEQLNILLVQRPNDEDEPFANYWALPGGFIDVDLDIDLNHCALRKLKEKTNVTAPYLEQVGAFGNANRDPRDWSVTHVYFALLNSQQHKLNKGGNAPKVAWKPIINNTIDHQLAFDHNQLLSVALERLRTKVEYTSLPAYLLPTEFTLPELQKMYEIVLNRNIDKSSFRTRILTTDLVSPINKTANTVSRPAQLYCLTHPESLTYFPRSFKYNEKVKK